MMHQRVVLPHPWGLFELFDLDEMTRETDAERIYRKRLYIAGHQFAGGKFLLREGPKYSIPKAFLPVSGPDRASGSNAETPTS